MFWKSEKLQLFIFDLMHYSYVYTQILTFSFYIDKKYQNNKN